MPSHKTDVGMVPSSASQLSLEAAAQRGSIVDIELVRLRNGLEIIFRIKVHIRSDSSRRSTRKYLTVKVLMLGSAEARKSR